jgi:site-specific DNA recombinase
MQGHWANAAPYYRCRFPAEYALANKLDHPLNVTLRQDALLPPLDEWLASKFEPPNLADTIDELLAAAIPLEAEPKEDDDISGKIADCDHRLAQYRATLDAGADPATVAAWITETEAERPRYKAAKQAAAPQRAAKPMSRDQITAIVSDLSSLLGVLRDADPVDKSEIYAQLGLHGLRLTYHPGEEPGEGPVRTEVPISPGRH